MADQRADEQGQLSGTAMKRRGIFAAAAAIGVGFVARVAEAPVQATSGGGDEGFLALGSNPWYIAPNTFVNTPAISSAPTVIQASPNFGNFLGTNGADPVLLEVDARPSSGSVTAIWGVTGGTGNIAVLGTGGNTGVYGVGDSTGVRGAGSMGVFGSGVGGGIGVRGDGTLGVFGHTGSGVGVVGQNTVAGGFAGAFFGPVVVSGDFIVVGGGKSAAVPHPDGSHRRLYCLESPESWFEDFGTGRLECGRADIPIDPDFAAVTDLSDYHVFLTNVGDHKLLSVMSRTPTGFTVEAAEASATPEGKSELTGTFSWRIVGRRKDIRADRFAPATIPPEPALPPQDVPTPPPLRGGR